jgi:hypothetical protein
MPGAATQSFIIVCLSIGATAPAAWAQPPIQAPLQGARTAWPQAGADGDVSVWVSYSKQYDELWSHRDLADREVDSIAQQHVRAVFLTLSAAKSTAGLQRLSDRGDAFTKDVQYLLTRLAAHNIVGCAAILSDTFTGAPSQMARYALVDHLLDFNASARGEDARFACVSTDLEMTPGSREARIYDLWKKFHASLRERVAGRGGGLSVVAWMQGPDYLLAHMAPADRQLLMARERITQDPQDTSLYRGALRYFTTLDGAPVVDAAIPMWYFTPSEPYEHRVEHNLQELQALRLPNLYLIAGVMVRNQRAGVCCPGCIAGRSEFESRLAYDQRQGTQSPTFAGTAVFMWPIPSQWTCD